MQADCLQPGGIAKEGAKHNVWAKGLRHLTGCAHGFIANRKSPRCFRSGFACPQATQRCAVQHKPLPEIVLWLRKTDGS